MKINVIYNKDISGYKEALQNVEKALSENGVEYASFELREMKNYGDFSVVIGGDGTLLNAARFYSSYKVPVLGVNIGRLGFLAQSDSSGIESVIKEVLCGNYNLEERLMLTSGSDLALNDFVIKGCNPARTSKFFLEKNGKCGSEYNADGLIISPPTGCR